MLRTIACVPALWLLCELLPGRAAAAPEGAAATAPDSVRVEAIGGRYGANWLHRALFGSHYRALWTTPIAVPVLDLSSFAGGLTPVSRGGGRQTTSLRLRAADGSEYYFRSIDKDPTASLPKEFVGTSIAAVIQDQTSAQLPVAPLLVAPLLTAAGVLHGEPHLFILPDDERLGEFRSLAGLIGILEPRIANTWGGAAEIITGDELFKRVAASPDDRVDVRAFLKARLMDILVGDWDRHRDQWSWARFDAVQPRHWVPIPRDRDFAMVRYDGLVLDVARVNLPQLIQFGPQYSDVLGLTWNGRELDRRFLLEAEWPEWEAVVTELQAAVTDSVIADAVHRLPPEFSARWGARLVDALERRRDALGTVALRFYRMLAEQAEVYGTDVDEIATLRIPDARTVVVQIRRTPAPDAPAPAPYYVRTFSRHDTREIRLFLTGGRDSVRVEGEDDAAIALRVIGGDGEDATVAAARTGTVRMYDDDVSTAIAGRVHLDARHYQPPAKRYPNEIPPRDWGHDWEPAAHILAGPDYGFLFALGLTRTNYGFRKLPYASQHRVRFGMATEPGTFRADYRGRFRRSASHQFTEVRLFASGFDDLYFHGFGNELAADRPASDYRVTQRQFGFEAAQVVPLGPHVQLQGGPLARYVATEEGAGSVMAELAPYGGNEFGQIGARGGVSYTSNRAPSLGRSGIVVTAGASAYPAWWDVTEGYAEFHGEATGFLHAKAPLEPAVMLRAGGKSLWGRYPYFEAAYIGERGTVRLGRENRYAGDASSYATAELHLTVGRVFLGVPSSFGIMGLADTGRVWVDGETSSAWHSAVGGGVWLSLLDRANTISLAIARSEEHTAIHFQAGFGLF
jgi:hypothetical protein